MGKRVDCRRLTRYLLGPLLVAALVVGALSLPVAADGPVASVDAAVKRAAAAQPTGSVRAIVLGRDASQTSAATIKNGGRVLRNLSFAGGVAVELSSSAIDRLSREAGVRRIVYDAPMISHRTAESAGSMALTSVYPWALMVPQLNNQSGGSGVGVAVVDSGVEAVADFGGRVIAGVAFDRNGTGVTDDFGHGTAVASVIGGSGALSQARYEGIAPGVNLINIKVGDVGGAYVSDVVTAIRWVVAHKNDYNIRVINLSLTSSVPESYKTSILALAVEYAWFNGIVVVVSAGNAGPGTVLYAPANDPYVITVGATDDAGTKETADDTLAVFSGYGLTQDGAAKPELVAPGRHIVAALSSPTNVLATLSPQNVVDGNYIRLSGSSLAAGAVSGVVAQLLQAHPEYRPDQVKWLLASTASAVRSGGGALLGSGAGYPSALRAVRYGGALQLANRGLVPNNYLAQAIANAYFNGVSWDSIDWDGVSWDGVSWDGVSWDGVSWDGVSWDGVSWDGVSWDGVSWDFVLENGSLWQTVRD